MSFYANVVNGIVQKVLQGPSSEIPLNDPTWLLTDEFTFANKHLDVNGFPDGKDPFRGNFACVGHSYDSIRDIFIPPQPYPSWILNESSLQWQPPIAVPEELSTFFMWNESSHSWDATKY